MLLKKGSTGDDVKAVQNRLGLSADGIFGSATERAVKNWQASNGLTADGVVGNLTWNKMFAVVPAKDENGNQYDDDGNPVQIQSAATSSPASTSTTASVPGLSIDKLKGVVPDSVLAQIPECASKFAINTNLRLAHFLSQCAHESLKFTAVRENLNYSADGLRKVFPSYFPGDLAESYARQPEKIGARVYADRMGNGNEASGDGYTFRGRGYIQLTGRDNYKSLGQSINQDLQNDPDLVASEYPLVSAAWFWNSRNINAKADLGAGDDAILAVTKLVNGGTNGLADRTSYFKQYYGLLQG